MNKVVNLYDIDSKYPNLALMKLSAYYKRKGYKIRVNWYLEKGDLNFASIIFTENRWKLRKLPEGTVVGGSGTLKWDVVLPAEIESIYPDYELYGIDYAMGFTTRGCNRRCPFCIVPQKEGKFRVVADIYQFWNGQEKLRLLDNSLNSDEEHFTKVLNDIIKNRIRVDFNQGLDIRLLTEKQAWLLSKVRRWKPLKFAWDFIQIEKSVRWGIKILAKYGLANRSKIMFYVLIGFNSTYDEDRYRVEVLRSLGMEPFVMPYNRKDTYQKLFARWVNRKWIFHSVSFEEFIKTRGYKMDGKRINVGR